MIIATLMPSIAQADAQWSARLALGGGLAVEPRRDGIFESALRSEVLFGRPGDEHVRLGFALDVRQKDFESADGALGAALLFPTWRGYPIVLSTLAGWSLREGRDRAVAVGTFAWGYRGYNYHGAYGLAFQAYVSARFDVENPEAVQITFGVELDWQVLAIPAMMIRTRLRARDPDEPPPELADAY